MSATGWSATFWNVNDAIAAVSLSFCLKWHFNFFVCFFFLSSTFSRLCQYRASILRTEQSSRLHRKYRTSIFTFFVCLVVFHQFISVALCCLHLLIGSNVDEVLSFTPDSHECARLCDYSNEYKKKQSHTRSNSSVRQRLNRQRNMDQLSQKRARMHHELVCIAAHSLDVLVHSFELWKCSDRWNCLFAPLSRYSELCARFYVSRVSFQVQR